MGETDPVIETLPDGYHVRRFAPDASHPQGKVVLLADRSPLREKLQAEQGARWVRHQELQECQCRRLDTKRASLTGHPAVPAEKRCV